MSEDRMGVRASETGAANGCELCVGARNLIPLWEQQSLLTAEPSLQIPVNYTFFFKFKP